MAVFISIPLKKTSEVDLIKPLKNVIASNYSTADEQSNYNDALTELNKLRMNSTWRTLDKHESSLEVMYRYYDQLSSLESKCPASDIQIPFKWKDAFDKGSFFSGSTSLTVSSLAYERLCILFNIAAIQTQIAASQGNDISDDNALKSAAKYFQQASGIFRHLKHSGSSVHSTLTPDLQSDTLTALECLMLAQAQESFYYKAIAGNMKDNNVAKIAAQCDELYSEAAKHMGREPLRSLWEKDWLSIVFGKQAAFAAIAEYHQAMVCRNNKEVGQELGRLQHAQDLMKTAEQKSGINFSFKDISRKISLAYDETKKDNDFIYHERIPDVKSLTPVSKAALAKPIPVPEKFSSSGADLFGALLPVSVSQALQKFDVRKTEVVNAEIGKLRQHTQLLNGILASLNLPAALEDTTGCALPQSIQEKAHAIREKGGIQSIEKLIYDLPELLKRNMEILDEAERMLQEEEDSDKQLRSQFTDRWTRNPSEKLNEPLKNTARKYREIITNAVNADAVVREKFNKQKASIELLSKSDGELQGSIPSGSPTASNSPSVQRLKQLMEEVQTMTAEREVIESELKSSTVDMKPKFLNALTQDGAINEQALSVETLGECLGALQKQVQESLAKQERLVEEIQAANRNFCQEKDIKGGGKNRENALMELAAAHDTYMEITANLEEGTKFYNDLTQLLLSYQNKISDFCFARKTEKEELVKDLQQNIINKPVQATPTPPAHHVAPKSQPPPRPPPPSAGNPYAPSAAGASAPMTTAAATTPYPVNPSMPQPQVTYPGYPQYPNYSPYPAIPMPTVYNPYAGVQATGAPQQFQQYNPYQQYPPQQAGYPAQGSYPYPRQPYN